MSVEELVKRLRGVDHMSVEDCFLQSPLFGHAADKLEELAAEVECVRDGNRYAHLEQIAIKRANKAEAALAEKDKEIAALREALREAAAALDQAREDVACWGSYAGEYFQDKHDLEGDLDRLAKQASAARRVLEGGQEE